MSTRSTIGIEEKPKKGDAFILGMKNAIEAVYCHSDGYPEWVGKKLLLNYNTPEKVRRLISMGDISYLHNNIGEKHSLFDEYEKASKNEWSGFYHRDRGDPWEDAKPKIFATPKEWDKYDSGQEYVYLYARTGDLWDWYFKEHGKKKWTLLKRHLKMMDISSYQEKTETELPEIITPRMNENPTPTLDILESAEYSEYGDEEEENPEYEYMFTTSQQSKTSLDTSIKQGDSVIIPSGTLVSYGNKKELTKTRGDKTVKIFAFLPATGFYAEIFKEYGWDGKLLIQYTIGDGLYLATVPIESVLDVTGKRIELIKRDKFKIGDKVEFMGWIGVIIGKTFTGDGYHVDFKPFRKLGLPYPRGGSSKQIVGFDEVKAVSENPIEPPKPPFKLPGPPFDPFEHGAPPWKPKDEIVKGVCEAGCGIICEGGALCKLVCKGKCEDKIEKMTENIHGIKDVIDMVKGGASENPKKTEFVEHDYPYPDWNIFSFYYDGMTPSQIKVAKHATRRVIKMIRENYSYNDIENYLFSIRAHIGATDTVVTDIIAVLIQARDRRVPGYHVASPSKSERLLLEKIIKGEIEVPYENPVFSKETPGWLKAEYEFNPPLGDLQFVMGEDEQGRTVFNISTPIDEQDPLGREFDVTPGFYTFDELIEWWYEWGETVLGEWIRQPEREHFENAILNLFSRIGVGKPAFPGSKYKFPYENPDYRVAWVKSQLRKGTLDAEVISRLMEFYKLSKSEAYELVKRAKDITDKDLSKVFDKEEVEQIKEDLSRSDVNTVVSEWIDYLIIEGNYEKRDAKKVFRNAEIEIRNIYSDLIIPEFITPRGNEEKEVAPKVIEWLYDESGDDYPYRVDVDGSGRFQMGYESYSSILRDYAKPDYILLRRLPEIITPRYEGK